ncbi:hypothetical protein J0B03_11440 [Alkalibacter rhizosphaerae]|uniref:TraX protein n=1 Tax=Alkalibacter rhizosphaerae TaxID=2815577 RepID=A0A974XEI7_9FIRM|nr:TraX family protein [Alkalibacter rhizosphaerae]QSX08387.1 hypothetical protein J0B03_11440 [Alkalibacter rhizosphaerae]
MEVKRNDILKVLAVLTMAIDHIGALLFPQQILFRVVGRLAFPIFAYQIAFGFEKTGNKNRYMMRMLIWALVTVWPFYRFSMIVTGDPRYQNVLFTFFFALVVLRFLEKRQYLAMVIFGIMPVIILEQAGWSMDYGLYGIAVVIVFHLFKRPEQQMIGIFVSTLVYLLFRLVPRGIPLTMILGNIQFLAVFAVFLIRKDWKLKIRLPKYFFYAFYPVHLFLLVLVYNAMN